MKKNLHNTPSNVHLTSYARPRKAIQLQAQSSHPGEPTKAVGRISPRIVLKRARVRRFDHNPSRIKLAHGVRGRKKKRSSATEIPFATIMVHLGCSLVGERFQKLALARGSTASKAPHSPRFPQVHHLQPSNLGQKTGEARAGVCRNQPIEIELKTCGHMVPFTR